jgi:hydrogenase maturation protein HypF
VDDSVVETLADGPHIVRRSRGYVPLPLRLSSSNHPEILATGSDEKSTPALAKNGYAVLGQYIGDLNSKRSMDVYENVVNHLEDLFQIQPQVVVTDKHPSYFSHRYALSLNLPVLEVQHHLAHALSVMEEHSLTSAVAVIYDGTGYGDDGTLWGSEVMQVDGVNYKRLFHFGYIPLVGGEKAIEQPWRLAAALLDEKRAKQFFGEKGIQISQLAKTSSFPLACGMGRIFDAVSALLNVCQVMTYEGEPAQKLQMIAELNDETGSFADNVRIENQEICTIDIIENVLELLETGHEVTSVARLFHNTIVELTTKILMDIGCSNIVISGGTFQNVLLYNQLCTKLRNKGFNVYRNLQVPMNDNGLALGQIAYVLRRGDQENVLGYSNADNRDKWQHSPG